jgi:Zn-finger protein
VKTKRRLAAEYELGSDGLFSVPGVFLLSCGECKLIHRGWLVQIVLGKLRLKHLVNARPEETNLREKQ